MRDDHYDLVDKTVPRQPWFHLDENLEKATGFSVAWWKKRIAAGEARVVQRVSGRSGSRQALPRPEIVRVLAGCVK